MGKKIVIGKVYWDQEKKRWYSINSQEEITLDQRQVEIILDYYQITVLAEHFPTDVLAITSPEELKEEYKQVAIVSLSGEDDDDSITYMFWDRRKNTWMEDTDPNDGEEHEPSPTELSNGMLEDFFLKHNLHNLYHNADEGGLLKRIIRLPLEELKKLDKEYS